MIVYRDRRFKQRQLVFLGIESLADKKKNIETESEEKKKKLQERKEREEREKQELERKKKEKEKKQKAREARIKKKEIAERKRIKEVLRFPFKTLFEVSLLISFLAFIAMFFGMQLELMKSVFNSFFIFSALYLGFGVVIIAIAYVMSEKRKKEMEEQKQLEAEQRKAEEEERQAKQERLREEIKEAEMHREEELKRFRERIETNEAAPALAASSSALGFEDMSGSLADEMIGGPSQPQAETGSQSLEELFQPEHESNFGMPENEEEFF